MRVTSNIILEGLHNPKEVEVVNEMSKIKGDKFLDEILETGAFVEVEMLKDRPFALQNNESFPIPKAWEKYMSFNTTGTDLIIKKGAKLTIQTPTPNIIYLILNNKTIGTVQAFKVKSYSELFKVISLPQDIEKYFEQIDGYVKQSKGKYDIGLDMSDYPTSRTSGRDLLEVVLENHYMVYDVSVGGRRHMYIKTK